MSGAKWPVEFLDCAKYDHQFWYVPEGGYAPRRTNQCQLCGAFRGVLTKRGVRR